MASNFLGIKNWPSIIDNNGFDIRWILLGLAEYSVELAQACYPLVLFFPNINKRFLFVFLLCIIDDKYLNQVQQRHGQSMPMNAHNEKYNKSITSIIPRKCFFLWYISAGKNFSNSRWQMHSEQQRSRHHGSFYRCDLHVSNSQVYQ